jgi:hypothetical protein
VSDRDKITIGTRRRLLSSDFNDGERLVDRALLELTSATVLGDAYKVAATGIGGVVAGLEVRAVPGSNKIQVLPGIAFVAEAPADSLLDPPINIIELRAAVELDIGTLVDGANPRLITIEIAAGLVSKLNEPVDVFDPVTGTFGVANQDIVVGSTPVVTARAGVASPNPVVATGPGSSGLIPLAVVKLSTSQASFTDAYIGVLLRRPLLAAAGGLLAPTGAVEGGGFSSGEVSGAIIDGLGSVELHDFRCELSGYVARGHGPAEFGGSNIRTISGTALADLTNLERPIYGYAVPPPWAADYGSIAPSESRHLNPNNLIMFSTAESVVLGDGSTFGSLAYGNGPAGVEFSLQNMLVVLDPTVPSGLSYGATAGPQAGPPRVDDLRGTHPTIAGGSTITLDATTDPTWGPAQIVSDAVYLGAYSSIATILLVAGQSYRGRGFVHMIDIDTRRPSFSTVVNTGALDPLLPGHFPGMQPGDNAIIPAFATRVEVSGKLTNTGAAGIAELTLKGAFGFGPKGVNPDLTDVQRVRFEGGDLPNASEFSTGIVALERDQSGQCYITGLVGGGGTIQVALQGYEDPILASR